MSNCTYANTDYHTIDLSDPDQLYIWRIGHMASIISIILSFLGASFIVLSFVLFRSQLKNFRNRLILYLSLNEVIFSMLHLFSHSYFLSHDTMGSPGCDGEWVCKFDGFIIHFLSAGSFFWIIVISYYLFKRVVLGQQGHIKDYILMILVWGSNLLVTIIIFLFPKMSPRILWCCVSFDAGLYWTIFTFVGPCAAGFVLVAVSYLMVIIKIRKVRNAVRASVSDDLTINRRKKENQLVRTLLYYPLVYLYQWLIINIVILITLIYYYELTRDQWLLIMKFDVVATCNVNLAGAFNSLVYGYNANLREEYRKYVRAKIDAQSGTPQAPAAAVADSNLTDESEPRRPSRSTKFLEWIEKKL